MARGESADHGPGHEITAGEHGERQRHTMGEGRGLLPGGNFGVGSLPGTRSIPMGGDNNARMLTESERGPAIKQGAGEMHATAHHHEGPHNHRHTELPKGRRPHHVGGSDSR